MSKYKMSISGYWILKLAVGDWENLTQEVKKVSDCRQMPDE
jgi:hypothetical protein